MQTLTKGPIIKTILKLAVPIMVSSFLGTLYNICDMAWVGMLGSETVAGIGVGGMYLWLASSFASLPRIGGQVLTAQAIGSGDIAKAKNFVRAAIQIVIFIGIFFGAVSLIFTPQMVGFFNLTDAVSSSAAINYLRITCGLITFNFLNFTLSGLSTADGDSKTPMIANFCGLFLNMILDPLLILGVGFFPRLEGIGAAIATVFSQIIVLIILLISIKRKQNGSGVFHGQKYLQLATKEAYIKTIQIGFPVAIKEAAFCFISMLLTRFVSGFGAIAVAVSRVGSQIESISWNMADGFSSAVNSFCAQNYGAKEYGRIKKGYSFSLWATFLWGMIVLLCFTLFPRPISSIFFHEEAAITCSMSYLVIIGFSEPFLMSEIITEGAMSGLGKTKLCSIISIILTGIRVPLAYGLMNTSLGLDGIWWTYTISSVLKGIIFAIAFFRVCPKEKRV